MNDRGVLTRPAMRRALEGLRDRPLNFDLTELDSHSRGPGWHLDERSQPLPPEPPGPPEPGGSYEVARRLMLDYEFADPSLVRAIYFADAPLDGRDMLLQLRFLVLRFRVGVRVVAVREGTRTRAGRPVALFGWSYATLEGHLEVGRMDYDVRKWLDSGAVEFRLSAVSRMANIRNPAIRLGFRLFGRREQLKFYRRCGERMARFTEMELRNPKDARGAHVVDDVAVSPATSEQAEERR
jgi:uncharacterized protein (UPF0548 family)